MLNKREITEHAMRLYKECDQLIPLNDVLAFALWHALSSAAKETLRALVNKGPVEDGDVPSKCGRDELIILGLASKACVKGRQGFQTANYMGWEVLKAGDAATEGEQQ